MQGLKLLLSTQRSAQIELGMIAAVVALGLPLGLSLGEWLLLSLAAALILAAEAFNTSIELLADKLHPARHPQIGAVKDVAAAAVLITALGALAICAGVFSRHFFGR